MSHIIGSILWDQLLKQDAVNLPNYIALAKMAIDSIVNAIIRNPLFWVFYYEKILNLCTIDFLLSYDSKMDFKAENFATKI